MGITTAEFSNVNETAILTTYDDGRPDAHVPDVAGNRDRAEIAEWESLPNTITPFVDVAGRVAEAQTIAIQKLGAAFQSAELGQVFAMGGFNFISGRPLVAFIAANLVSATPASLTLTDNTNVQQVINVANQQGGLDALRAVIQPFFTGLQVDITAVNAAGSVANVDAALAASTFGDLSPVF